MPTDVDDTAKEIEELVKEGGDVYQKYADRHGITRTQAKVQLFPVLYGRRVTQ